MSAKYHTVNCVGHLNIAFYDFFGQGMKSHARQRQRQSRRVSGDDEQEAEALPQLRGASSSICFFPENAHFRVAHEEDRRHAVRREEEAAGVLAEEQVRAQEAGDVSGRNV